MDDVAIQGSSLNVMSLNPRGGDSARCMGKTAYYSMKVAGAILMAAGTALTVGGAVWAWPKVVSAMSGLEQGEVFQIAECVDTFVYCVFKMAGELAKGGNTGIFAAGFILLGGLTFATLPLLVFFGGPLVPGGVAIAGGYYLCSEADTFYPKDPEQQ